MNGQDVSKEIRCPSARRFLQLPAKKVREALVRKQKEMAGSRDVVMDGRDIGTVVLQEAEVKIFLQPA